MPTKRFENLSENKRKRIHDAIIHEYTRTVYGELQFSRIARDAQVSRSSLYTYFPDKEDLFQYARVEAGSRKDGREETV